LAKPSVNFFYFLATLFSVLFVNNVNGNVNAVAYIEQPGVGLYIVFHCTVRIANYRRAYIATTIYYVYGTNLRIKSGEQVKR